MTTIIAMLTILFLSFVQNISFSIVSRSRNRNNMRYHLIAAFFSNTIWFITFRQLVKADMTFVFFVPYCMGTMLGSVFGVKISMWIESKLGAAADGHLKSKILPVMEVKDSGIVAADLADYWKYLETRPHTEDHLIPKTFAEWLEDRKLDGSEICPGCKINPIDANRDTCVDCSH